eukprot:597929-Amphidinium_carterae.1
MSCGDCAPRRTENRVQVVCLRLLQSVMEFCDAPSSSLRLQPCDRVSPLRYTKDRRSYTTEQGVVGTQLIQSAQANLNLSPGKSRVRATCC